MLTRRNGSQQVEGHVEVLDAAQLIDGGGEGCEGVVRDVQVLQCGRDAALKRVVGQSRQVVAR
jgi:hypothetical protein